MNGTEVRRRLSGQAPCVGWQGHEQASADIPLLETFAWRRNRVRAVRLNGQGQRSQRRRGAVAACPRAASDRQQRETSSDRNPADIHEPKLPRLPILSAGRRTTVAVRSIRSSPGLSRVALGPRCGGWYGTCSGFWASKCALAERTPPARNRACGKTNAMRTSGRRAQGLRTVTTPVSSSSSVAFAVTGSHPDPFTRYSSVSTMPSRTIDVPSGEVVLSRYV